MEGPPADPTKMEQVRDGFSQPGVKLGYSVFDGAPGKPRALQIDAIDANGESMVSSNIYDLARAGIEVPIPPADLKPGTYTREQIEQALASQRPTTTQTSGDVTQSPQSAQPTEEEIDDATVAAAEREVDEIEADSTEPAKEIAPDALGEVAPKSVLRVTLQDGTVIEGNYNNAQGNGFIRDTKTNEYRVLTGPAMGPKEQDNPVTKVEMLRDGLDVQAEQDGRKFGEPAYKQPKTRDEYENTLFDLALKATTRSENYDQAEARRSFQLQAQFDRLADEIQLSKVKRRYILAQAARRARGEPLQNPNEFAEGPIDSLRYGVPRSSDFDPDAEKRTKNRAPLPPHAYMTKAEVESSLADARMKGSTTKNPKRREKMAQIVQLRKQQLATGKYREAVQAALDASKNEKPKYDKSSTQVTLPEEQAKPFRDFAASIADEDVYTEEGDRTFGRETEPHITALYGIENDDVDAVKTALAGVGPIKVALGEVTAFENADKPYDVLKVDVNSPALRKVNAAIKQGTKNSSDFPDYKPHLTIGYVKKGTAKKYVGDDRFAGETLSFNSLQFRTRDGRSIDIPLTGSTTSAQTTTQAPGSGEGITNGQLPQGSATKPGAGTLPSNGQSQKVPTEAEGQVGGQQPAPGVRPGAGKGPAIPRGSNTPARFAQVATQAAGLKNSDTGAKFLRDFAPRLQKANPKAFADMEVNVLTDAEWKAHPSLSKSNPDSAAAFNIDRNILHLNADKVQGGQKIAEAIVHEAGHFAEFFALGEEFTQQQWESLTDEQRQDAAKSYDWKDERPGTDLKTDRRARAEWVAMQFTRVITGDTAAMDSTLKQKLQDWLEVVREVVQQWLGNKRYTTAELDSKILELMGYVDDRPKPDMTPVPYQEIDYSTGDIFEVEKPVSEIAAEAKQSVKRYEALLECLNR
jgi:2'-5' RNA ligase